jgi:hypothetical protein
LALVAIEEIGILNVPHPLGQGAYGTFLNDEDMFSYVYYLTILNKLCLESQILW